VKWPRCIVDH